MWSDQQQWHREYVGSRWRGWFTAWRGIDHGKLHDIYYPQPKNINHIKIIFSNESSTKRSNWYNTKNIWFVRNLPIDVDNGFVFDNHNKNIWMDAITYTWWMKPLPITTEMPPNNWLLLMGKLKSRLFRYSWFQYAKHHAWPIIWSAISTSTEDEQDVKRNYSSMRKWCKNLPRDTYDVFPTTYNSNIKFSFDGVCGGQVKTDIDYFNSVVQTMMPANRAIAETHEQWPDYRLHLCCETQVGTTNTPVGPVPAITEKTFRAIAHGRPFVILGSYNTLAYLRKQGYHTYHDIFDESYDDEVDPHDRFNKLCKLLDDIKTWDETRWQLLWPKIIKIAKHNHKNFIKHHRRSHRNIQRAKKTILTYEIYDSMKEKNVV